jgi:hypothetical protein
MQCKHEQNFITYSTVREPCNSIVTVYRLDGRGSLPTGAKDFSSSLCVQIDSGAHPASYSMGTGGPFPWVKRGRGVTLTTHRHLVPMSRVSKSYTSSPPKLFTACSGTALHYSTVRQIIPVDTHLCELNVLLTFTVMCKYFSCFLAIKFCGYLLQVDGLKLHSYFVVSEILVSVLYREIL